MCAETPARQPKGPALQEFQIRNNANTIPKAIKAVVVRNIVIMVMCSLLEKISCISHDATSVPGMFKNINHGGLR